MSRYALFSEEKRTVFESIVLTKKNGPHPFIIVTDQLNKDAKEKSFSFLASQYDAINQEVDDLFQLLKQDETLDEAFWLYCYYCCCLLEQYHTDYDQPKNAIVYRQKCDAIIHHLNHPLTKQTFKLKGFLREFLEQLKNSLVNLLKAPSHVSEVRSRVAISNGIRVYWTFCRLTIKSSLLLLQELKWLEKIGALLGKELDADKIIKILETPNPVLNIFSVGLFATRAILNAGMVLKHLCSPTEREKSIGCFAILKREISKRHCDFLNDIVWATVNGLTNFPQYSHVTGPAAIYLTAGFLVFDVALLIYRRQLAQQTYLEKSAVLMSDFSYYMNQLKRTDLTKKEKELYLSQLTLIQRQKEALNHDWQGKSASFSYNIAAAMLFVAGFSSAAIIGLPILMPASFFICLIGVSMYLTADGYGNMEKKRAQLTSAKLQNNQDLITVSTKEYQLARNDYMFSMGKNIIMPTLIISTFILSWQAGLILLALFAGIEMTSLIIRYHHKNTLNNLTETATNLTPMFN